MTLDEAGPKPCPFCGSDHVRMQYGVDAEPSAIYCAHCKAVVKWPIQPKSKNETFGETIARWMEKWNTRT